MNVINLEHIHKIYGAKSVFEDVSCSIHAGDKIGIIGMNGTGKTTLLKMIASLEEPDNGQIIMQNGLKTAYLPQNPTFFAGQSVLACVLEGREETGWTSESEAKAALNRLGITEYDAKIDHLSGGQKKKVALAKIMTTSFDILLLDEPTNHLDYEMLAWLEDYLKRCRGVVLMVTHDRYFLDRVCSRILEISYGQLYSYDTDYSGFLERKAQREERELASERKRQSVLRMELEWAKRGCRARSTKQRARLQRLEALKNGTAPTSEQGVALDSVETRMGKKTIELHGISKGYGGRKLIQQFEYIILKNQRLGIIGSNGCGKSTLLKIIAGLEQPDAGAVEVGETIRIGYFAQELPDMETNQERRVIDYIRDIAEYVPTKEGRISASMMLERFLFTPDMQYAPVSKLSGGEKKRLHLLSVLMDAPNVLALDEISNDLDIPTLTILEDYLNAFAGIVVTVSHDRYFLDNVVDRIFAFEGDGVLRQYEGGYTDYLEARSVNEVKQESQKPAEAGGNKDWKQNQPVKLKFTYKEQKEYEVIDEEIAALEDLIEQFEAKMTENATNSAKLSELLGEKEEAGKELEFKMERWIYLNDLAEKIEAAEG